MSTVKLRQAGFAKTIDTEDAFRKALQFLLDHKLLPPPRNNPGRDTPFARTTFASPKHDAPTDGQPLRVLYKVLLAASANAASKMRSGFRRRPPVPSPIELRGPSLRLFTIPVRSST